MKLNERAQEILEMLWVQLEEKKQKTVNLGISKVDPTISELEKYGYINITSDKITLTDKGKIEGKKLVRRHRLSERLFADIFDIKKNSVHPISCQFEHLIYEEVEEAICTLLGHPKFCPHGQKIPEGNCCIKSKEIVSKVIKPLTELNIKEKAKIAYLHTQDTKKLQKIMALGILPGMSIVLLQKFPSYVFEIGYSQYAIDESLAKCIFVRSGS